MLLLSLVACFDPATDTAARERLDTLERGHTALAATIDALGTRVDATLVSLTAAVRALESHAESDDRDDDDREDALAAIVVRMDALEAAHADEIATLATRLASLEAENAALRADVDATRTDVDELVADVADLQDTPAGSVPADLLALDDALSIDAAGDLVLDGVNLYVRSGAGATDAAPNGKGNLILGYAEGTGSELRTGSHTLVAGTGLDWRARWGLALGVDHVLSGDGGALLGGSANNVSGTGGVSIGGYQDVVTHLNAVTAAGARRSSDIDCGFRASGSSFGSGC